MNLPDQFNAATYFVDRHLLKGGGNRTAIECGTERITYAELSERVNRFGNALRSAFGVRTEERVFLLLPDCPEFAYAFFGAIKIGAVPVPVNTLLKPHDFEFLLNDTRARVAVVSDLLLPSVQQLPQEHLCFLEHIVAIEQSPRGVSSLDDLLATHSSDLDAAITSKDDAAFWLYSSGSTGTAKACIHLQHDMVVASESYAKGVLQCTENDRFFSVAKLFFAYGLGNSLYFPLAVGGTSILMPGPPSPRNVYDVIEQHRPTLFFSVPSNYAALLDFTRNDREFDLSSIRSGVSAGEALPRALFERFQKRFGVEILDGIGSTEALHMFISNRPGAVRAGSSGNVVPGCEIRLRDDDGRPTSEGKIGTLLVKSDSTCAGYWNRHAATKDTFEGHWMCTGDTYRHDKDGYFWYAGRRDDMFKVSGVWLSPHEIESVLVEHNAVAEAAVVAQRDKDELLKPVAYVVIREGFNPNAELAQEIQKFVTSRLPVYKRPRWVEFLAELPKTATGKVQRFKLR